MAVLIDKTGNAILLQKFNRIISLVPSQTELLFDLELDKEVIGITKFCVHPEKWFRSKQRVGGTKTVDVEKVRLLKPDLILANKEENVKEQVEALQKIAPVYVSDITTLEDALQMIEDVGKLVARNRQATEIVVKIKEGFEQLERHIQQLYDIQLPAQPSAGNSQLTTKIKAVYFIWKDPYMVAGGDTFINDLMEKCGFENTFKHFNRYPEISISSTPFNPGSKNLISKNPADTHPSTLNIENCQFLFLSSEPYPFKQKHLKELTSQIPGTKIVLVDGEMFSWYGSRLVKAAGYFKDLITELYPQFVQTTTRL